MASPPNPIPLLPCPGCAYAAPGAERFCGRCGTDLRGLTATSDTMIPRAPVPAPRQAGPAPGTVLDGRYRILEKLGEGGMGAVYKAEHVRMGKVVALKLMRPEAALDEDTVARFHQEARIVSRLSHLNTVSVFDFGELEDRSLYMAMEYVPGGDLAALLRNEGALSERRALPIAIQVLRSLAEAHDAGIVHRDIKPGNAMLVRTREGEDLVKVVDFGIAKLAQAAARGAPAEKAITGVTALVGTPNYMSPEQIRGEELDGRSDLYSLGAMLFELLTGRPPFSGDNPMQVVARHLSDAPPSLSSAAPHASFSPLVEAVLQRALEKDRQARFPSADEMRKALEAARDPLARTGTTGKLLPSATPDRTTGGMQIMRRDDWEQFERALRRKHRLLPVAALLTVVAIGAAGWQFVLMPWLAAMPRDFVTRELEPNDAPLAANLIRPGTDIRGLLVRPSREAGDVDLFEFEVKSPAQATISVSGIPNVNVALHLFGPLASADDGKLRQLAHVDDQFLNRPERMSDVPLQPGRYLVKVSDKRRADEDSGAPRENTLDPYNLRVDLADPDPLAEHEPNNSSENAMPLSGSRAVLGHAGSRGEHTRILTAGGEQARVGEIWSDDFYELGLPRTGTGCLLVSGVPGATLSLWTAGIDLPRLRKLPDPRRERAITDHLGRMMREKAARLSADEVASKCARGEEALAFRVRVEEGSSDSRYLAVSLLDSEDGLEGLRQACVRTIADGQSALCRRLLEAGCAVLPRLSPSGAAKARERLLAIIGEAGVSLECELPGDEASAAKDRAPKVVEPPPKPSPKTPVPPAITPPAKAAPKPAAAKPRPASQPLPKPAPPPTPKTKGRVAGRR